MKYFIGLMIGLLLGLLVGSWGPQRELSSMRIRMRQAEEKARTGGQRSSELGVISDILRREDEPVKKVEPAEPPVDVASGEMDQSIEEVEEVVVDAPGMGEAIDDAREVWKLRSELAQSAFIDNADLNEEEALKFKELTLSMNVRLEDAVADWAEQIKNAEQFSEESGIRMLNELSEVLVLTYDEMDGSFGEDWRMRSGNELSLPDLIDPDVMTPLLDVENLIEEGEQRNRRRRNPRHG